MALYQILWRNPGQMHLCSCSPASSEVVKSWIVSNSSTAVFHKNNVCENHVETWIVFYDKQGVP